MALTDTKEMFRKAYEGHYAIGAFNVNNMEIIQGIMEAAHEEQSAVILQASEGARNYAGSPYIVDLVKTAVRQYPEIPVALHLDHGSCFEVCKDCIDGGFTSVMFDGSKHPFEENVRITKQVVEYAHAHGVVVEAELGRLAGVEDLVSVDAKDAIFTDPEEAAEFVALTGCDSLAIAIGTSHGAYKYSGEPYLDYERLEKVGKLLPNYPIVLHGASTVIPEYVAKCNEYGGNVLGAKGVPEDMLRKAATMAVCKINIDTDVRLAMTAAVRESLVKHPENFDPRSYLKAGRQAVKDMVSHKIQAVVGSSHSI
ncbi:class II fructose-1,6-bisphosphate aldolase [Allisonella histaminiformans]|uniref:class II fructose-1,6-bisphosphate aldolase n=1 Tax=Allisonella histaminiformans TaxID=209880 RepID=UPI002805FD6D|nr:class II fructose-1,6-bisphosphate aldolase [Allisonella histaminiformans]